jgi:hypothetical protein
VTQPHETLEHAARRILLDGLSAGLKAAVDGFLVRGASKPAVLAIVKSNIAKARQHPEQGKLTLAAVEAYLETK